MDKEEKKAVLSPKVVARCTDATFNTDELVLKFECFDKENTCLYLTLDRQKALALKKVLKTWLGRTSFIA